MKYMKPISKLSSILGSSLSWSKPKVELLSQILMAFFAVRTVNLKQVANAISGDAKTDSRYRRLQRFFSSTDICYDQIARLIVLIFLMSRCVGI